MEGKITTTEIITTTYQDMPEQLLESFLDFQEALHRASRTGNVLRTRPFRHQQLLEPPHPNRPRRDYFAIRDQVIIGQGRALYEKGEQDTNPNAIEMFVRVHPDYRRQGIGSQLFAKLNAYATELGRTKVETWFAPVDGPAGPAFATKFGFVKVMEEKQSRLYREKINWDFIHQMEEKYASIRAKYRFELIHRQEWADRVLADDQFAEAMADFYTEVGNLVPREDLELNDFVDTAEDQRRHARFVKKTKSTESLAYYAFDGDRAIAMSETYYPNDPPVRDVGTGLTGVRKAYQRQGLASVLKCMMIRLYVDTYPEFEYIYTENAASNEGMLSINMALGFAPHVSWESWQRK